MTSEPCAGRKLEYFGVPAPGRRVALLDPVLKRHLLAMITTFLAAVAMTLISYAMLEGLFNA
jgi:hypothetical protein